MSGISSDCGPGTKTLNQEVLLTIFISVMPTLLELINYDNIPET